MGESMESMFRRGAISKKVMKKAAKPAILRQTRAQKSKMADFDGKQGRRDQGGVRDRGAVSTTEMNNPANQRVGRPALAGGLPSRGAQASGNKAGPTVRAIDENTGKKWPSGGGSSVKKSVRRVGVEGLGGKLPGLRSSGPQYGGPSSRKYG